MRLGTTVSKGAGGGGGILYLHRGRYRLLTIRFLGIIIFLLMYVAHLVIYDAQSISRQKLRGSTFSPPVRNKD